MNKAFEQVKNGVQWVLDNRTSYRVAKDLEITNRTINRYQNGETPMENMSLGTANKLYNYYLEELEKMRVKDYKLPLDVNFNNVVLEYNSGGKQIPEENLYEQHYINKRESLKEDFNHYSVWWDLTEFFNLENQQKFEWPAPHSVVKRDDPELTIKYFSGEKFIPLNKETEINGIKMTIINHPVKFSSVVGEMIYYAGASDEEGNAYQIYWNIFNIVNPCKVELTVDNSKYCTHCLKPWKSKESKCVREEGHEFKENK